MTPLSTFVRFAALTAMLTRAVLHAQDEASLQGTALLKTDIMGVFAHPDDETGVAGVLAHYALGGQAVVANIYCTRGEGGGNMVGTQAGQSLGILREAELRDCLTTLGVRYCYFLDRLDFFYTESAQATLLHWGKDEALERLVRLIRALRPDVVVTMNPMPRPGQHGHHQAAGILATEAFSAAADPNRFPRQLTHEGLDVWQVRKLYYGGVGMSPVTTITMTEPLPDGRTPAEVAGEALSNHRSQAFGRMRNAPWLRRPRQLSLIRSVVPPQAPGEETDLLRGLPPIDANPVPVYPVAVRMETGALTASFAPRPAVANFQEWAERHQVSHFIGELPADLPVVEREPTRVWLDIVGGAEVLETVDVEVDIDPIPGWGVTVETPRVTVARASIRRVPVDVMAPSGAHRQPDVELVARLKAPSHADTVVARATLHPVPRLEVAGPRRADLQSGFDSWDAPWLASTAVTISHEDRAQGRADDASDSSAAFQLAHDGQFLGIDVVVRDDVLVSNIAPNDIRGHWRSDSIEICVDPDGGAENTLNCFKVGIFPFDAEGRVRAARDADARQGEVEETAPGMRLVSHRTPDGYRIRTIIPFKLLGFLPEPGKRIGFNIIVYDGDKSDAALGENINESRIAWSPRSGVQGRPEDWGRVVFR